MSHSTSTSTSSSSSSSPINSNISLRVRSSAARGHANHGWLNSFHTFSFASYYDPKFNRFHSLRVINEDRVSGGQGFGTHPHSNYEIFSYILSGALSHKDSMGNLETIRRGDVQFTSAGTGITHSEFNGDKKEFVHFLQIWVKPDQQNLKPRYSTMHFGDAEKEGKLRLIVAPQAFSTSESFIPINQDIRMYASIIKNGESVSHILKPDRSLYIHLIQDVNGFESEKNKVMINVNGKQLKSGDGAFIEWKKESQKKNENENEEIIIRAETDEGIKNEFVLFDIKTETDGSTADDD